MIKLLLSIRNIIWYQKPKKLSMKQYLYVKCSINKDLKFGLTELLLRSVGLCVANEPNKLNGIYLTTIQKNYKIKAELYGYTVMSM